MPQKLRKLLEFLGLALEERSGAVDLQDAIYQIEGETSDVERRSIDIHKITARAEGEEGPPLDGYIAVFDRETDIGPFREVVRKSAFNRHVQGNGDTVLLWQHDPKSPFARTTSGTLRLTVDDVGLRFEADPVDAQWSLDAMKSIRRRDVTGGSFGFNVAPEGQRWVDDGKPKLLRELLDLDIPDVSIVTWPAYKGTRISARSRQAMEAARSDLPPAGESVSDSEWEGLQLEIEIATAIEEIQEEDECLSS